MKYDLIRFKLVCYCVFKHHGADTKENISGAGSAIFGQDETCDKQGGIVQIMSSSGSRNNNVKTIRIPNNLLKVIKHRAVTEGIDESTAMRQLITIGARNYAVDMYKNGKLTLNDAAALVGITVREMVGLLLDRGITGNVRIDQQQKSLKFALKKL
jgi:predicted HTH domain antitoxin